LKVIIYPYYLDKTYHFGTFELESFSPKKEK